MKSLIEYVYSRMLNEANSSTDNTPDSINLYNFVDSNYKGYEIFELITGTHKFKTISEALKTYGVKDYEFTKYTLRPYIWSYTPASLNSNVSLPKSRCFDYIINGTKMSSMRFSSAKCNPVMKEKTIPYGILVYILIDKKAIFILPRLEKEYIGAGYACILDDERYIGGEPKETKLYKNLVNLYHDRERIEWIYDILGNYKAYIGDRFVSAYECDTWKMNNRNI